MKWFHGYNFIEKETPIRCLGVKLLKHILQIIFPCDWYWILTFERSLGYF